MTIKGFPAALVTFVFGFGLGCIPGLNEHLHWNLWYIVPISGVLFGCVAGGIQFGYCFKINEKVDKWMIGCLIMATVLGYASVDYGIYRTTTFEIAGVEGMEDGIYKLSDLISFTECMKLNLGSSSVDKDYGTGTIERGAVGTTISYFADLGGAALGTLGVLVLCVGKYPYCGRCRKYKRREREYSIMFAYEEELANGVLGGFGERIAADDYEEILSYVRELAGRHDDSKGDMKVTVDHRLCPMCGEATIIGKVERRKGKEWNEISELAFEFSQGGEA